MLPYWHDTLKPALLAGRRVLVVAHGNSLRALIKYLDNISDEAIVELNIPTGVPIVYEFDEALNSKGRRYLGNEAEIAAKAAAVAKQGKSKG